MNKRQKNVEDEERELKIYETVGCGFPEGCSLNTMGFLQLRFGNIE